MPTTIVLPLVRAMMQRSGGATQHAKHTASSPNAIRSIKVYLYRVVYCCNWNACLPQSRYIFTETYTAVIGTPVFPLLDLRCPEDIMKSKVNHITPNGNLVLVVYKYYCCRLDLLGCVPWCAFVAAPGNLPTLAGRKSLPTPKTPVHLLYRTRFQFEKDHEVRDGV